MPGAVAQRNNPANDPNVKPVKHHSNFRPNQSFFTQQRYGDIDPIFAMPVVQDDHISLRLNQDVDTFTLKAPVMTPIRRNTTHAYVPLRAILPENYELLVTNPLTGDDIDASKVNTVSKFGRLFAGFIPGGVPTEMPSYGSINSVNWLNRVAAGQISTITGTGKPLAALTALVFCVSHMDFFFSKGSLANKLGVNFTKYFYVYHCKSNGDLASVRNTSYDKYIDSLASYVRASVDRFNVTITTPTVVNGSNSYTTETFAVYCQGVPDDVYRGIDFRSFLQRLREGDICTGISGIIFTEEFKASTPSLREDGFAPILGTRDSGYMTSSGLEEPVNYGRLVAYQLLSTQFFTDDAVDFVYTCPLYHQNQFSLAWPSIESSPFYTLNGARHSYDSVSGYVLDKVLYTLSNSYFDFIFRLGGISDTATTLDLNSTPSSNVLLAHHYIANIFAYQRSLRYRDYFVGSRVHPLGVGDTTVHVTNNTVSVIDVTKNIQMQRFLNQVNRIGRTLKAYTRGIFGVTPATNPEECIFLANTCDIIGGEETNNTGADQLSLANSTTAKFRGESNKYAFEIDVTDPGYILSVVWYEVARPYIDSVPRDIFHVDRFDMFNPYLENIGDQDLKRNELGLQLPVGTFAYKMRYAEYKQSFDRCVGAFSDGVLPGYALPVSTAELLNPANPEAVISPYFIRPHNSELDPLYVSLTHYSLSNYFHFIARVDISVDANRPMEAAPQIL